MNNLEANANELVGAALRLPRLNLRGTRNSNCEGAAVSRLRNVR